MVTKKNSRTSSINPERETPRLAGRVMSVLRSEAAHFMGGIVLIFLSAYVFLSYISFFFTGYADQSVVGGAAADAANSGGEQGANLSYFLINGTFGVASIFFIAFALIAGLHLMRVKRFNLWKVFFTCLALAVWFSLFLGFAFWDLYKDTYISLGGLHGKNMAFFLHSQIGTAGTWLLLVSTAICIMVALNRKTMQVIRDFFSGRFFKKKSRAQKQSAAAAETGEAPEAASHDKADEPADVSGDGLKMSFNAGSAEESAVNDDENAAGTEEEAGDDGDVPQAQSGSDAAAEAKNIPEKTAGCMPEMKIEVAEGGQDDCGAETAPARHEDDVKTVPLEAYDPKKDLELFKFPSVDLLNRYGSAKPVVDMEEQNYNKNRIVEILRSFGIEISSISATIGPTITLYEITPEQGVRIAKIRGLEDDIALSLKALGIRIIAPIPGKGTIGIEVPNVKPQIVSMHSIVASRKFQESTYELPIALGKTITNEVFMVDLTKMPHVLVAGATGQGKSVGLNAMITSLLYKKHPAELKFVMVDPKKVEFGIYSIIEKHYLAMLPDSEDAIITDVTKVIHTLNSLCIEMDSRYDLLKMAHVRNIKEYNQKFISRQLNPEKGHRFMPYIVVVIDEFGDLIMTAGKEVELPIARIAQLARAVGIHMIIATQRPTTNIITGTIKANFPARIAFRVASMTDSRTILDRPGANQLIGKGDMLFLQGNDPVRVQCAFVDTDEVDNITKFISSQQGYTTPYYLPEYVDDKEDAGLGGDFDSGKLDSLFEEAARLIVVHQQGSTSLIQRKFSIGYNRAGRIMDQLEKAGIVGPADGSKPRQVLCMSEMDLDMKLSNIRG